MCKNGKEWSNEYGYIVSYRVETRKKDKWMEANRRDFWPAKTLVLRWSCDASK